MSIIIGRTPECSAIDLRMNVTEIGRLSSSIGQVLVNAVLVDMESGGGGSPGKWTVSRQIGS
jgi:hypothetical protein